ncbi:MAG: hypothetical protein Q7R47_03910, partial [Candidatus Diapherotrites archaeon]|nr:hypothetical protein [Candidatus Diapherotrites archaeon]
TPYFKMNRNDKIKVIVCAFLFIACLVIASILINFWLSAYLLVSAGIKYFLNSFDTEAHQLYRAAFFLSVIILMAGVMPVLILLVFSEMSLGLFIGVNAFVGAITYYFSLTYWTLNPKAAAKFLGIPPTDKEKK